MLTHSVFPKVGVSCHQHDIARPVFEKISSEVNLRRTGTIWAALVAAIIVATTLYGTAHFFSPIPYEDQWDGYVGFFMGLDDHAWKWAWWSPQNEHRIVFARALFWIDRRIFGGYNVFDVVATVVFMLALCISIVREATRSGLLSRSERAIAISLTFGLMFLWTQYANFTSGFQNEFVAVYLFGVLGFAQYSRPGKSIVIPIGWGILSSLCMAIGVATIPVMVVQGILLRRPLKQLIALAIVGAVVAAIYMHHLSIPMLPVSPDSRPGIFFKIRFFLTFLGNPAFYLFANHATATLVGLVTFVTAAITVPCLYLAKQITSYRSFLIAGYGLVVASALGAAHSRWVLGLEAAVGSRYTTPSLLGIVLLILLALDAFPRRRAVTLALAVSAMTVMGIVQTYAVGARQGMPQFVRDDMFPWRLAVLGPKIGLDHPKYGSLIFPADAHGRFVDHAKYAAETNLGPYRSGWLHDAGIVKYDPALRDDNRCIGMFDGIDNGEARGWLIAKQFEDGPTLVVLTHGDSTVGYGVTGDRRPDVAASQEGAPADAGWRGFASTSDVTGAYAYLGGQFCQLTISGKPRALPQP